MRIAIDASSLAAPSGGIGRYLEQLLTSALALDGAQHEWLLYGRGALTKQTWGTDRVRSRSDHLPADAGRVLSLASSIPAWLHRDQPDVFWGPAHRLPWGIPKRTASVVTVHDMVWRHAPTTMRRVSRALDAHLMPGALQRADRIIAVSDATRNDLSAEFPHLADKMTVIHEAATGLPPALDVSSLHELGIRKPYLLFVGTLEPRKNLVKLLRAFARMAALEQPHAQFVVAGASGWGGDALSTEVERLALGPRVITPGWVSDEQLSTLYKHARCFAMPSLYEGFGLPLLEAMQHGTPVLTSRSSSMPEVMGDAGLLVDPSDVEEMASALCRLFRDDALHERLSRQGRERTTFFNWARAARETLAELEKAVQAHRQN